MDFAGWIDTWRRVLTQPGEPVFEQEKLNPNGTLQTALIWVVLSSILAAVFVIIGITTGIMSALPMMAEQGFPTQTTPVLGMAFYVMVFFVAVILAPLGFMFSTFIMHLVAKLLGGEGEYTKYAYLVSTYQAPLGVVSSIVSIAPVVGLCVSPLIGIYSLVLNYFAIKVNYQLSGGRAITAILIPLLAIALLAACISIVAFASLRSLMNELS